MYAFISGIVEEKSNNLVILSCNGIGYEIFVSHNTLDKLPAIKQPATVYTYLHVKEDAHNLYGFLTKQEKQLFLSLITVSGVGAKTAIAILSGMNYNDLISAILIEDIALISKIKGVGKKTAERIVLELKNSLGSLKDEEIFSMSKLGSVTNSVYDEAVILLVEMGLNKLDALKLVNSVADKDDSIEQIVAKSLKAMK